MLMNSSAVAAYPASHVSMQFVATAEQLLGSLSTELFAAAPDTEVMILLGPSPMRAQEVYSMTCSTAGVSASQSAEVSSEQPPATYTATAAKTVLRKLILATAAGPEGPASKGERAFPASVACTSEIWTSRCTRPVTFLAWWIHIVLSGAALLAKATAIREPEDVLSQPCGE